MIISYDICGAVGGGGLPCGTMAAATGQGRRGLAGLGRGKGAAKPSRAVAA